MAIFATAVGPTNQPVSQTSVAGTGVQVVTSPILVVGGQVYNGKPFSVVAQGYVKAHGATQTIAIGFQGQKYAAAFSGTQLGTGNASGAMIAGTVYPFYLKATLFADNTSGILAGSYTVQDGVTPGFKAGTVLTNLLTGVSFGTNNVGTNVTNPLASAQAPALQFALTFTNRVSDTSEVVSITSFYATNDN